MAVDDAASVASAIRWSGHRQMGFVMGTRVRGCVGAWVRVLAISKFISVGDDGRSRKPVARSRWGKKLDRQKKAANERRDEACEENRSREDEKEAIGWLGEGGWLRWRLLGPLVNSSPSSRADREEREKKYNAS
ncbi:hypothetical protein V9T40_007497 [Parthenolecanium corni]|uniref:Uncharacterized protein n=1 Tax=Parthenolecanium corni TaxID=536013 RepID=A0AAN9TVF4_9HEMI